MPADGNILQNKSSLAIGGGADLSVCYTDRYKWQQFPGSLVSDNSASHYSWLDKNEDFDKQLKQAIKEHFQLR